MAAVSRFVLPAALLVAACSSDCDDSRTIPSYFVALRDANSQESICDAVVTMDLKAARTNNKVCGYAFDIPVDRGSVTIRAEHPDYLPASVEVSTKFSSDHCGHPVQKRVSLTMVKP